MSTETYSYSRLNVFDRCKFGYYLQYVEKIKVKYTPDPSTNFGLLLHHLAEHDIYDYDVAIELARTKYKPISDDDLKINLRPCIQNIQEYIAKLNAEFPNHIRESKLNVPGPMFSLTAKVDRICYGGSSKLKVIDYKTNTSEQSKLSKQLKLYNGMAIVWLANNNIVRGVTDIVCELFYVRLNKIKPYVFTRDAIVTYFTELVDTVKMIESTEIWSPSPSEFTCKFCNFKDDPVLCSHSYYNRSKFYRKFK